MAPASRWPSTETTFTSIDWSTNSNLTIPLHQGIWEDFDPFTNRFDLDGGFLVFAPNADGGYDMHTVPDVVPPVCFITNPVDGSTLFEGEVLSLTVNASDNGGVNRLVWASSAHDLNVDLSTPPFSTPYTVPAGITPLTFTATAYDGWRNSAICTSTVSVVSGPAPTLTITSPPAGTTLVAGGAFDVMGGLARHHLAALDLDTGAPTAWNPNADGSVRALARRGSTLYVGGSFKHVGGQARNRLAAVDIATALPDPWNPGVDSTVRALAVGDSMLYVGGSFQQLAGEPRFRMGALDFVTGQATAWRADVTGTYPDVYALVVNGPVVYAGGDFYQVGGQAQANLVALDRVSGAPRVGFPRRS